MAFDSLIPFALNPETDQLVDVGSVPRGKACGCICPSCKTPLTARQGEEKEWHFAHRSQNVHRKTEDKCEYSFVVSVRMMIRQLSEYGLALKTPAFWKDVCVFDTSTCLTKKFPYQVTNERILHLEDVSVGCSFGGILVDVLTSIGDFNLVIYVTYKDRKIPEDLLRLDINNYGVLDINVSQLFRIYQDEKQGRYTELLRKFLSDSVDGKSWVYHPREASKKLYALKKRDEWLEEQKRLKSKTREYYSVPYKAKGAVRGSSQYKCILCNHEWQGPSFECEQCRTHLYTVSV